MAIEAPILIAQGDDDQIVPIVAAADKSIKLVQRGTLKVYSGTPHGIYWLRASGRAGQGHVGFHRGLISSSSRVACAPA